MPEDVLLDFFAFYTEFLKTKTFDGKMLYCFSLSKTSGLDFTSTCNYSLLYCFSNDFQVEAMVYSHVQLHTHVHMYVIKFTICFLLFTDQTN